LVILHRGISSIFEYIFDASFWSAWNLMPVLSSALIWPLVFLLLRSLRRSLRLT
jgi:cell shape-determining protein MreD